MSHYDSGALAGFHLVTSHTLCAVGTFPYTNVLAAAFLLFIFEELALVLFASDLFPWNSEYLF